MITRRELILNLVLGLFAVFALVPILGVLLTAFTPASQARAGFAIPHRLALGNFAAAWQQGHFATYMLSSVIVTVKVVVLTSVLSVLAGFAFATMQFPGGGPLFFLMLMGLICQSKRS